MLTGLLLREKPLMAILLPPHTPYCPRPWCPALCLHTFPKGMLCPQEVFPHLLPIPSIVPPAHQGQFVSEITENAISLIWQDETVDLVFLSSRQFKHSLIPLSAQPYSG